MAWFWNWSTENRQFSRLFFNVKNKKLSKQIFFLLRAIASGVLNNTLKFEINRMNSFFFYLRHTEKSDFEKNEFKVLGTYIFAHSWGRPTARYLLKQVLEPEILWISLQKFNSMTFEISKKNRFFENSRPPSPLKKNKKKLTLHCILPLFLKNSLQYW